MTTIAASLSLLAMAADSRTSFYDSKTDELLHATRSYKLYKTRRYIIGCAGHGDDIDAFLHWLANPTTRRRRVKEDFAAMLLTRRQLLFVDDNSTPEPAKFPFHAIGSGAGFALAAMTTMHRLGLPLDPQLAVDVACEHDQGTAGPVDVVRWKPLRNRREPTHADSETV